MFMKNVIYFGVIILFIGATSSVNASPPACY